MCLTHSLYQSFVLIYDSFCIKYKENQQVIFLQCWRNIGYLGKFYSNLITSANIQINVFQWWTFKMLFQVKDIKLYKVIFWEPYLFVKYAKAINGKQLYIMILVRNCKNIFKKQFQKNYFKLIKLKKLIQNRYWFKFFLELFIYNSLFYPMPSLNQKFKCFLT